MPRLFPNGRRVGRRVAARQHPGRRAAQARLLRHHAQGRACRRLASTSTAARAAGRSAPSSRRPASPAASCSPTQPRSPAWSPGAPARQVPPHSSRQPRARPGARDRLHPRARGPDRRHARRALPAPAAVLSCPDGADLLFHPDLTHWESKSGYPALIGVVRDRAGEIIGLHRTYLVDAGEPETVGKAAVAQAADDARHEWRAALCGSAPIGRGRRRSGSAKGSRPASPS